MTIFCALVIFQFIFISCVLINTSCENGRGASNGCSTAIAIHSSFCSANSYTWVDAEMHLKNDKCAALQGWYQGRTRHPFKITTWNLTCWTLGYLLMSCFCFWVMRTVCHVHTFPGSNVTLDGCLQSKPALGRWPSYFTGHSFSWSIIVISFSLNFFEASIEDHMTGDVYTVQHMSTEQALASS